MRNIFNLCDTEDGMCVLVLLKIAAGHNHHLNIRNAPTYIIKLISSSSSFITENIQLDEGYFPAHAWHDNFFFLLIFIFYNFFLLIFIFTIFSFSFYLV